MRLHGSNEPRIKSSQGPLSHLGAAAEIALQTYSSNSSQGRVRECIRDASLHKNTLFDVSAPQGHCSYPAGPNRAWAAHDLRRWRVKEKLEGWGWRDQVRISEMLYTRAAFKLRAGQLQVGLVIWFSLCPGHKCDLMPLEPPGRASHCVCPAQYPFKKPPFFHPCL